MITQLTERCGRELVASDQMVVDKEECCICLSEYEPGEIVIEFKKCPHIMHKVCLDKWLKKNPSCPYCKQNKILEIDTADANESDEEINPQDLGILGNNQGQISIADQIGNAARAFEELQFEEGQNG